MKNNLNLLSSHANSQNSNLANNMQTTLISMMNKAKQYHFYRYLIDKEWDKLLNIINDVNLDPLLPFQELDKNTKKDLPIENATGTFPLLSMVEPSLEIPPAKRLEIVQALIRKGANVNQISSSDGSTPLHAAVACDELEVITALLEAGAEVNALDKEGKPPVFEVRSEGAIDLLVEWGADLTITDNNDMDIFGQTDEELHIAIGRHLISQLQDAKERNRELEAANDNNKVNSPKNTHDINNNNSSNSDSSRKRKMSL